MPCVTVTWSRDMCGIKCILLGVVLALCACSSRPDPQRFKVDGVDISVEEIRYFDECTKAAPPTTDSRTVGWVVNFGQLISNWREIQERFAAEGVRVGWGSSMGVYLLVPATQSRAASVIWHRLLIDRQIGGCFCCE